VLFESLGNSVVEFRLEFLYSPAINHAATPRQASPREVLRWSKAVPFRYKATAASNALGAILTKKQVANCYETQESERLRQAHVELKEQYRLPTRARREATMDLLHRGRNGAARASASRRQRAVATICLIFPRSNSATGSSLIPLSSS
jgi:hypothetical protein